MSKRDYNIWPKCWDEIFPLARMYLNNILKSPVSERIGFFCFCFCFFFWDRLTVSSLSSKATSLRCKFSRHEYFYDRKRGISAAENFYAALSCIFPKHAIVWSMARARFLWVRTEEKLWNSSAVRYIYLKRGLLIFYTELLSKK